MGTCPSLPQLPRRRGLGAHGLGPPSGGPVVSTEQSLPCRRPPSPQPPVPLAGGSPRTLCREAVPLRCPAWEPGGRYGQLCRVSPGQGCLGVAPVPGPPDRVLCSLGPFLALVLSGKGTATEGQTRWKTLNLGRLRGPWELGGGLSRWRGVALGPLPIGPESPRGPKPQARDAAVTQRGWGVGWWWLWAACRPGGNPHLKNLGLEEPARQAPAVDRDTV